MLSSNHGSGVSLLASRGRSGKETPRARRRRTNHGRRRPTTTSNTAEDDRGHAARGPSWRNSWMTGVSECGLLTAFTTGRERATKPDWPTGEPPRKHQDCLDGAALLLTESGALSARRSPATHAPPSPFRTGHARIQSARPRSTRRRQWQIQAEARGGSPLRPQ